MEIRHPQWVGVQVPAYLQDAQHRTVTSEEQYKDAVL